MAAPPGLIAALNAAAAGQIVTQAQLNAAVAPLATHAELAAATAPLATQAQLNAAVAPLATQAQLAAATAPLVVTQVQLAAAVAQLQAQIAALPAQILALLAPANAPAAAAAAAAAVQAIVTARARNAHDRRLEAYAVVPRADGTLPPHWPAGFDRAMLMEGSMTLVINPLLTDYGLPVGGLLVGARRDALALHIGTTRS